VHDWPSCHTKIGTKEKVPSEVAYLDDGTVQWGSSIKPSTKRHMWTKLRLETSLDGKAAKIVGELSSSTKCDGKQPVDIVSDFLTPVRTHLVQNLDNRYGRKVWETLPIILVVTVPAVWSDAAKDRTFQAVQKGGFTSAHFPKLEKTMITTEPEAAAIYTIKTLQGTVHENQLKVGDGFTVCDMGGGTVDLISYRVAGLDPIVIEEATIGNGDQCGGTFVDRAFLKWLERRLGTTDFVKIAECRSEDVPRTSLAKKAAIMLQDFTLEAKSSFSGTETNYLRLPAPLSALDDDEARGICDGEITIMP
jgi:molecular chaperone DnaK (HSP70)